MGEWLNSGGGGRFTVLHGGARIFFLWAFNPRKVSDVFLVFFLCFVFSDILLETTFWEKFNIIDCKFFGKSWLEALTFFIIILKNNEYEQFHNMKK